MEIGSDWVGKPKPEIEKLFIYFKPLKAGEIEICGSGKPKKKFENQRCKDVELRESLRSYGGSWSYAVSCYLLLCLFFVVKSEQVEEICISSFI